LVGAVVLAKAAPQLPCSSAVKLSTNLGCSFSETYQYYDLPFCRPKQGLEHKLETLGEVVDGNRLMKTPYNLTFRVERDHTVLCSKELSGKELKKFRKASASCFTPTTAVILSQQTAAHQANLLDLRSPHCSLFSSLAQPAVAQHYSSLCCAACLSGSQLVDAAGCQNAPYSETALPFSPK
jgi:Endomembrane protein 70